MASPLTKDHLDAAVQELARHFNGSVATLRKHTDERFDQVDHHFLEVHTKLDAIMSGELLVTRKQLGRLLHALKSRGIELDEREILAG